MDSQHNFVFSFQQYIQSQAIFQGYPYFPNVIQVLFDESYYRSENLDVWAEIDRGAIASGSAHFSKYGVSEGREPSAFFDEDLYLLANPDVKAAVDRGDQRSGLWHYVLYGFNEGRDALAMNNRIGGIKLSAFFDEAFYLKQYGDIADAVKRDHFSYGYEHFMRYGLEEGRDPSILYNEQLYLANNLDVKRDVEAGIHDSGLVHYLQYGHRENRVASLLFDPTTYRQNNPDVADGVDKGNIVSLFAHFIDFGAQEGRIASYFYEEAYYLNTNPDVKAAVKKGDHPSGYAHFLNWGMYEGRSPSSFYNEQNYLRANPDVQDAVNQGILRSGLEHYVKYGMMEGRPLASGQSNRPPIANNDSVSTTANTAVTINALANDSDPDGDTFSISGVGNPSHGTAQLGSNGAIVYTPGNGFSGTDTFNYTLQDSRGNTDTATVTVNVLAPPTGGLSYANSNKAVWVDLSERTVARLNYGANFHVMPVGDSITEGWDASKLVDADASYSNTHEGYRLDLQQKFDVLGFPIDLVGSEQNGPNGIDKDHEGHPGEGSRFFLQFNRINTYIGLAKPDVILFMLGTNDAGVRRQLSDAEDQTIADNMLTGVKNVLTAILNDSSFTGEVLIGTLAPAHPDGEWAGRNSRFTKFNNALAAEVATLGSNRLSVIEVGSLLDSRQHMADPSVDNGLHPNQAGYAIMANAWYDALTERLFDQQPTSISSTNNVTGSSFDDLLVGNGQANVLEGGAGDDLLTGNGGPDQFVYRQLSDGFDIITDFGADDIIRVYDSGFAGDLAAGFSFVRGSNPSTTQNRPTFLYNTSSGILSYDSDGTGSQSAIGFLQLEGAPNLEQSQIAIA